jgi:hypothetical protein
LVYPKNLIIDIIYIIIYIILILIQNLKSSYTISNPIGEEWQCQPELFIFKNLLVLVEYLNI